MSRERGTPPGGTPPEEMTRKERREHARTQRKALEQAEVARAARRRRLIQLGGLAGTVVVIIVVIAVVASGSGTKKVAPRSAAANQTVAEVKSLLNGIPQSGNRLGNPNAPVTVQYFGDLECPVCREFTLDVLPTIISEYVRPGKVKIEYHSLATATANAEREGAEPEGTFKSQQTAAYAAGSQNKAWYFIETFYHEQGEEDTGYVTEKFIQGIAEQVPGLNLVTWTADRSDSAFADQLVTDEQTAATEDFTGTPSFLMGKTGTTLTKFEPENTHESGSYTAKLNSLLN